MLFIEDHKSDYLCEWWESNNQKAIKHIKSLLSDVEIIDRPVEIHPMAIDIDLYVGHPEIIKLIHEGRREKEREAEYIRQQEAQQINAQIAANNAMGIVHPFETTGIWTGGYTTGITFNGNTIYDNFARFWN